MNLGQLTTESRNPASENLDCLSAMEIVHLMNAEDAQVAPAVRQVADAVAAAIDVIADRLRRGGRLVYIGAGTSGRLAVLDAAECPPTFNSPPWQVLAVIAGGPAALTRAVEGAEDHPQKAKEDLQHIDLCASDVLVGIATSGRTPYVVGGIAYARSIGTYTIGLSCNDSPQLSAAADLTITPVVGPEVISGSTRLKAGTATKLVLNMLTTGAMVRLGKTYGNLMVDLQATNQKLADRSRRIVSLLTGSSPEQAAELLDRCHGDLKTAVVVQRQGIEPHEAAELLRGSGGQLRPALTDPPPVGMPRRIGTANSLVLGVDGGGSATRAWLAPAVEGPPLGIGQAGAANPHCAGWAAAIGNIDRAIELAFRQAGMNRQPVTAACLAVAGVGSESDQRRLELWAKTRAIADDLQVTHDGRSLLAAGAADGCGIALVSGTGSFAFGCNARGQTARSGGWGHLFGDEGSGYDVARRGLRAVSLAVDGRGPQTLLERELCDAVGQNQAEGMLRHVQGRGGDRQWIASLARCIVRAAEADDVVALGILDCAADALAKMVDAIRNRLGFQRYTLVLGGGLLANAEVLREKIADQLQATGSGAHDTHVVKQPVEGAVRLARQATACRE